MDYNDEQQHNKRLFLELMSKVRPDLKILVDLLDKTNINLMVLFYFIKALIKINEGSGYGKILVEIQDGKVGFVRGEESTLINEEIQKEVV